MLSFVYELAFSFSLSRNYTICCCDDVSADERLFDVEKLEQQKQENEQH